jgi:hypothetical protein
MNEHRDLTYNLPMWVQQKLHERGAGGNGFFGKVILHMEHGRIVRLIVETSDVPQTFATTGSGQRRVG